MTEKNRLQISIVIPVLNESSTIAPLLAYIEENSSRTHIKEIIVVDGGSTDGTIESLTHFDTKVLVGQRGRAKQQNYGAKNATGAILYFLHADTLPPKNFDQLIIQAYLNGAKTGCFRMEFDSKNPFLRFFSWLSRINHILCRGGDQSLFIERTLFESCKGFDERYAIYEDTEFITRLYKKTSFTVLPQTVITSARKYRQKGWLRVQYHFGMIHLKNYLGYGPEELFEYYKKHLIA